MNSGKTIFSQLMDFLPRQDFRQCVDRYRGNYKLQRFSCWDQFLCMAFAQLTYRESLRDIEACLRSAGTKLYHMGIRSRVSRNTLANAHVIKLLEWTGDRRAYSRNQQFSADVPGESCEETYTYRSEDVRLVEVAGS